MTNLPSDIDLKVPARGAKGDKGNDGKTPIRGVDYWTDKDKEEIKKYVDDAILNGKW
ncbi:hypothetical protein AB0X64_07280 [Limosilactobacillus vaginalis]|uniref:hypothetical protein n=1 Tax=Limosilactobacillus vaginalis TaxID=1633 RepID=UPI003F1F7CB1